MSGEAEGDTANDDTFRLGSILHEPTPISRIASSDLPRAPAPMNSINKCEDGVQIVVGCSPAARCGWTTRSTQSGRNDASEGEIRILRPDQAQQQATRDPSTLVTLSLYSRSARSAVFVRSVRFGPEQQPPRFEVLGHPDADKRQPQPVA